MFAGGERHTGSRLVLKLLLALTLLLCGGESEVRIIFLPELQGVGAVALEPDSAAVISLTLSMQACQ